ncbi:unnamed protein product [Paramecium primaurelia]|uniref:Uncharacterized protein n=1 Tax=Paramecium primaurelia TaxID=5886 RepID=A0A8S1P7P0_PARPR|nr:unnamed protein product [Paramecium primaurelia]
MFLPQIIENLDNYQCCYNHNKPLQSVCIEPNYPSNKRFFCEECLKAINIEVHPLSFIKQKIENELKNSILQCEIQLNPFINLLKQFEQKVYNFKDFVLQEINIIINSTSEWIQKIEVLIKNQFSYSLIDVLEKLSKNIQIKIETQQLINQIKAFNNIQISKLDEKLSKFQQFEQSMAIVDIFQNIKHIQSTPNIFLSQDIQYNFSQDIQQNQKIDQNVLSIQHPYCYAIAINKEKDIIVTSSNQNLRIFQLNQGSIRLMQVHEEKYSKYITTLTFFKSSSQSNNFISGSQDSNIIIWYKNRTSQSQTVWEPQRILHGHTSCINCIISDTFDSLFISGSDDKNIKFWYPQQATKWICQQTVSEHTKSIFGLSINVKGDQLISCGKDLLILVMQNLNKYNWFIKQKIYTLNYGYRLCFITDNIFTFQPHPTNKNEIQIFSIQSNNGNYMKIKDLQIQGDEMSCYYYFPQMYIPQKQMLIAKNGQYVNFIKFSFTQQNTFQDCKLENVIDYGLLSYGEIFGTICEDGEYLITWDLYTKCIQIKKCTESSQTYNNIFRTYTYVSF